MIPSPPGRFDPALFDSYKDQTDLSQAFTDGMDFLNRWIYGLCRPHLGQRILEIGPGCGGMVRQLLRFHPFEHYLGLELSPRYTEALQHAHAGSPRVEFRRHDILDRQSHLQERDFDSVVAISCLEHIADDRDALRRMGELARPGGKLLLYLPALPRLYNLGDHLTGHFRRYNKAMTRQLAADTDLRLLELRYCNLPGILSWYMHGRKATPEAFSQEVVPPAWLVRMIVLYLALENHLPLPVGLNLFCVLEKPAQPHRCAP